MSALSSALSLIDSVAAEGDLAPDPTAAPPPVDPDDAGEPVLLPDGRTVYPPRVHGTGVDELACQLLDLQDPTASRFLRLIGPPGTGKSQIARAIALRLWRSRGLEPADRGGVPFYGFGEMSPGPSSDELFFRHDYVPQDDATVRLADSFFVSAMRNGWTVMIDEANTARDTALLSINATLDGRLLLYLPATGETVLARPGFCVLLAYNPGLVGATDLPEAWYSRFPACVEVRSNWAALLRLGAPAPLVAAAAALDERRVSGHDGLSWTPQFRDIESLWAMADRIGIPTALALFCSSLAERERTGSVTQAETAAACRAVTR